MTRDEAIEFIKQVHIGHLATVDSNNAPCVRPVSINTVYDGDLYFFTFTNTRKVAELEANPQVEAVWTKLDTLSHVRIKGQANLIEDESIKERFKNDNPKVAEMLPPGFEHMFCLYSITPEKVEVAEGLVPYTQINW
jgi:general stress protein 26